MQSFPLSSISRDIKPDPETRHFLCSHFPSSRVKYTNLTPKHVTSCTVLSPPQGAEYTNLTPKHVASCAVISPLFKGQIYQSCHRNTSLSTVLFSVQGADISNLTQKHVTSCAVLSSSRGRIHKAVADTLNFMQSCPLFEGQKYQT